MDKNLHNDPDDLFRSELSDHKENPSENVWRNIAADLDKSDAGAYRKKYFYAKRVAAILLVLLVSYFIYTKVSGDKEGNTTELSDTGQHTNTSKQTNNNIGDKKEDRGNLAEQEKNNTAGTRADKPLPEGEPGKTGNDIYPAENKNEIRGEEAINNKQPAKETGAGNNERGDLSVNKKYNKPAVEKNSYPIIKEETKTKEPLPGDYTYTDNGQKINNKKVKQTKSNSVIPGEVALKNPGDKKTGINEKNLPAETAITGNTRPFVSAAGLYAVAITGFPANADTSSGINIDAAMLNQLFKRKGIFQPSWTFTGFIAGSMPAVNVKDKDGNSSSAQIRELEENENEDPSPAAGVLANYQFNKKFAVQTGLLYSATSVNVSRQQAYASLQPGGEINYKVNLTSGYALIKPNSSNPPSIGDSIRLEESQSRINYISIPVLLRFTPHTGKVTVTPGIGMTANLLMNATLETEFHSQYGEHESRTKLNGLKKSYLGLLLNTDFRYGINKKMSLSFIPCFQYALTPITKNTGLKTYPYSIGAGLGFNISL